MAIYCLDSIIHSLNNWGQHYKHAGGHLVSIIQRKLLIVHLFVLFSAKRHSVPKVTTLQTSPSRPTEAGPRAHYPLTERQQLQYLLEVTAKEAKQDSGSSSNDDLPFVSNKIKKKDSSRDNHIEARIRKRNERGETALHVAAIRGDLEDVVAFIKAGAMVNAKDNAGEMQLLYPVFLDNFQSQGVSDE